MSATENMPLNNEARSFNVNITKLLENVAIEEGLADYKIDITDDGSVKGDGYIGIISSVKVSGQDRNGKFGAVDLIVKRSSGENQELITTLFEREVYMYTTVFPTFKQLELQRGLPPTNYLAKFYKAQISEIPEVLILENLKASGYRLYERRIPMDDDHVGLVMVEYGRLHAVSFALKDQDPEKYQNVVGTMTDHFIDNIVTSNFKENFIQKCTNAKKSLSPDTDKEALLIYEAFLHTIDDFFKELLLSVNNYTVVLHGDCWTNNMMFKYKDYDGLKPIQLCFLDFQISRQGSPVLDLAYFIYSCGSTDIINNLDHYMGLYYDSFAKYLQKLGSDPDKMFPFHVFQQHWKQYARYGLIFAMLVIHIMLTEKEEIVDLANLSESGKTMTNAFDYEISRIDEYYRRVKPIILHFVEHNFI